MERIRTTFVVVMLFAAAGMYAQINLTAVGYTENFDSYVGTVGSVPAGWTLSAATYRGVGCGTSNAGGHYGFGDSGENALGNITSGSTGTITISVDFVNTTGSTIEELTISYTFEEWRNGNGGHAGFVTSATGTLAGENVSGLDQAGGSLGTTNACPASPASVNKSITLTGLSITNNASFGLTFSHANGSGSDDGISIDDFSVSGIVLPVELTEFDAKRNAKGNVELNWITATEIDNEKFILEYRNQFDDRFTAIAEIAGHGNSQIPRDYGFEHSVAANGVHYYRLKQVDFDGTFSYSNVVSVYTDSKRQAWDVVISPNPAVDEVTIHSSDQTLETFDLKMYSTTGNMVFEYANAGVGDAIGLDHLDTGVYLLVLHSQLRTHGEILTVTR